MKMCSTTKSGASNAKISDSEPGEINQRVGLPIVALWNANNK